MIYHLTSCSQLFKQPQFFRAEVKHLIGLMNYIRPKWINAVLKEPHDQFKKIHANVFLMYLYPEHSYYSNH